MDVAVLLDEDVVEDVVGDAVFVRLHDGGVGQRLVVGHVEALVLEVEAVAHTAAVQPLVGEQAAQILEDFVVFLLIQVLRRGGGVVVAELDGDAVGQKPLHVVHQFMGRIVAVQHAVDPRGAGDTAQQRVGTLLHVLLQVAGDVHAGDFVPVPLREGNHLLRRGVLLHGEGGVDVHLVGGGDGVQHLLQGVQVRQGLAAGEHEVAPGGDGVHDADAVDDFRQAEAGAVGVFLLIDAERAVVLAVVGHEYRHRGAALSGFVGVVIHVVDSSLINVPTAILPFGVRKSKANP